VIHFGVLLGLDGRPERSWTWHDSLDGDAGHRIPVAPGQIVYEGAAPDAEHDALMTRLATQLASFTVATCPWPLTCVDAFDTLTAPAWYAPASRRLTPR
jgi:hypothetical protein